MELTSSSEINLPHNLDETDQLPRPKQIEDSSKKEQPAGILSGKSIFNNQNLSPVFPGKLCSWSSMDGSNVSSIPAPFSAPKLGLIFVPAFCNRSMGSHTTLLLLLTLVQLAWFNHPRLLLLLLLLLLIRLVVVLYLLLFFSLNGFLQIERDQSWG